MLPKYIAIIALAIFACTTGPALAGHEYHAPYGIEKGRCDREHIGRIVGGVVGAVIGSTIGEGREKTAAIAGAAVIGVIVGGVIGRNMDEKDEACIGRVLEHGRTERAVFWKNPDTGMSYEVVPTRTFRGDDGRYCRDYRTTEYTGAERRNVSNSACRDPDGAWKRIK